MILFNLRKKHFLYSFRSSSNSTHHSLLDSYPEESRPPHPIIFAHHPDWGDFPQLRRVRIDGRLYSLGDRIVVEYVVWGSEPVERFDISFVGIINSIIDVLGSPRVLVRRQFRGYYPEDITRNVFYDCNTSYLHEPNSTASN